MSNNIHICIGLGRFQRSVSPTIQSVKPYKTIATEEVNKEALTGVGMPT